MSCVVLSPHHGAPAQGVRLLAPGYCTGTASRPMHGMRVATVANTLYLTGNIACNIVLMVTCTDVYLSMYVVNM